MKKKWVDQENFIPGKAQVLDTDDIVDREGYRDIPDLVNEMLEAGELLMEARRKRYQYQAEDSDSLTTDLDPTTVRNFDPADIGPLAEKARETREKYEAEVKAEAEKKKESPKEEGEKKVEAPK